jgi:hypothetical protein
MQLHCQFSLPMLLQKKHTQYFKDAEKAKCKTGQKDRIQKRDVADARQIARNRKFECHHRQHHRHRDFQQLVKHLRVDPEHHGWNERQHHERHENLPDVEA